MSFEISGNTPDYSPDELPGQAAESTSSTEAPVTQQDLTRIRRLLWVFSLLLALLISPSVVSRIQYALVSAKERAQFDVAKENLTELNLMKLNDASRLLAHLVGPSVVNLRTHNRRGMGQGSGVIVDEAGYIVTNYHVIEGVSTVEVQLSDGRRGPASVVGSDPLVDLAVLKTELTGLHAAEWGDSDNLDVGEWVWALGSPFGFQQSITFGILSAKERRGIAIDREPGVTTAQSSIYQEYLQTDAAINPGNSGGPLVNVEGKIVGINTAIYGESYQGMSFSIPSSIAQASYEQLRENGHIVRGYLGVYPRSVSDAMSRRLGIDRNRGVFVYNVERDSPAWEAGLEVGDVILAWNHEQFSDPSLLSRTIAATRIGSKVPVDVLRASPSGREQLTLKVTVGTRPVDKSL